MARTYDIHFDSRDRINGSPWDATFQLNHPLSNVRSVYCKNFVFLNTFENITSTTNQFLINTLNEMTIVTIPPKMYTAASIVETLNRLIAPHGTVSLSGNLLSWNTRYGIQNISTTTLGLPTNGSYNPPGVPTVLTLASMYYVSLSSPSIQPAQRTISTSGLNVTPLIVAPIKTEFGYIDTHISYFPDPILCNNHALQHLSFQLTDPYSKRPLTDLQSWAGTISFQAD
jgi:hypothetical protein